MEDILIVSDKPETKILTDRSRHNIEPYVFKTPQDILPDDAQLSSYKILLLDTSSTRDLEKLVTILRTRTAEIPIFAVLHPGSLDGMPLLKKLDVKFFLQCPVKIPTLQEALEAKRNDRNYVDPALSDSLVELYLE
ncbi:MAG: hypothetical protein ABEK50_08905 [bacterium]